MHKDAGLSPGTSVKRCSVQLDKQIKQKWEHQDLVQSKHRHLTCRVERAGNKWVSETRGDTYIINIGQDKRNKLYFGFIGTRLDTVVTHKRIMDT